MPSLKFHYPRLFLALIIISGSSLFFVSCVSPQIKETEVGKGWSKNSINTVIFRQNAISTHKDLQFTAYYNGNSKMVLAKREVGSDHWEKYETQYSGNTNDAHNTISIAIDGDGFLHVSWDHHDNELRYAVSKEALGLELGEKQEMTGHQEKKVSYPQFYNLNQGNLLFLYRSGQSGRGSLVAKKYNTTAKTWQTLHQNLLDGENERNAYWQASVDKKGTIHLSWVWRETWDVSTNHDIAYAQSRDGGKTWQKTTGEKYKLPITSKTAEYAWKVPQNSSLINQTSITADAEGNPFIASYWNEEGDSATNFKVVYLEDGVWKKESTNFRTTSFKLGGGGTKSIPISRPEILVKKSNKSIPTVYLLYRDTERGNKITLAFKKFNTENDWKLLDLIENSVGQWEPNFDNNLFKTKEKLHLFVQNVTQIDGEGVAEKASTPVRILQINRLPSD